MRQWRPDLLFIVSVPMTVVLATTVVSLLSETGRWIRGAIAYLAVIAGAMSLLMLEERPNFPIDFIFAMVMGAVPAAAGVLTGWSAKLFQQNTEHRARLLTTVLLIPSILVVANSVRIVRDELRLKSAILEQRLLAEVPLGGSMADVTTLIHEHDWKLTQVDSTHGYFHQGVRPSRVEGAQHIEAYAGSYANLLTTSVVIYWGFDAAGRLTSLWVWKTTDGP